MPEPGQMRTMVDMLDRPSYWQRQAWDDLRAGMQGRGNAPEICLRNCINSLVKALERGALDIDMTADVQPGANGMPNEADLVRVWRAVASALELEALAIYKAQHDEAAQTEAIISMQPVAQ